MNKCLTVFLANSATPYTTPYPPPQITWAPQATSELPATTQRSGQGVLSLEMRAGVSAELVASIQLTSFSASSVPSTLVQPLRTGPNHDVGNDERGLGKNEQLAFCQTAWEQPKQKQSQIRVYPQSPRF